MRKSIRIFNIIVLILVIIAFIVKILSLSRVGIFESIGSWFNWLYYGMWALGAIVTVNNIYVWYKQKAERENKKSD